MTRYNFPVLKTPTATLSDKDAAQNIILYNKVQYNLCGQFCVAFCAQDETHNENIEDFLNYWEVKEPKWYQSLFPNKQSRTTSIYDLEKMLSAYGYSVPCKRFADLNRTPTALWSMLQFHQLIIGVKIDHTGYLVGSGIAHWVVAEGIDIIDQNHAIVDLYNPYTNKMEPYSWREFMNSTGAYKNGIYVER